MLRTNTKKAAANIRAYIMDGFTTEQEKTRYTEQQAEQLLTSLIYKELQKGERKA